MRFSPGLLEAVAAALPEADAAAIATREVHDRVRDWNRTTIRHALRALVHSGRASFIGKDRHRKYRRAGGPGEGAVASEAAPMARCARQPAESWRDYALRGDGSVQLPDHDAVAATMAALGAAYGDVDAEGLQREERLAGWSWRRPSSAALTRAVFGDPHPGRPRPS